MLKSLHNHRRSQQKCTEMADCWWLMPRTIISLSWSLNRLQLGLYQQAGETGSKYNYWRRNGLTEQ